MKYLGVIAALMSCCFLTSCAKNIDSNTYTEASLNESSVTKIAIVVDKNRVKIKENDKLKKNEMGVGGGAAGGILAGVGLGRGNGSLGAGLLGAAAGAVGGALVEDKLNTQDAFEYIVEVRGEDSLQTVIQGDGIFEIGEEVYYIKSSSGRSRLRPRSRSNVS